jgi:hypothetical protein
MAERRIIGSPWSFDEKLEPYTNGYYEGLWTIDQELLFLGWFSPERAQPLDFVEQFVPSFPGCRLQLALELLHFLLARVAPIQFDTSLDHTISPDT